MFTVRQIAFCRVSYQLQDRFYIPISTTDEFFLIRTEGARWVWLPTGAVYPSNTPDSILVRQGVGVSLQLVFLVESLKWFWQSFIL